MKSYKKFFIVFVVKTLNIKLSKVWLIGLYESHFNIPSQLSHFGNFSCYVLQLSILMAKRPKT